MLPTNFSFFPLLLPRASSPSAVEISLLYAFVNMVEIDLNLPPRWDDNGNYTGPVIDLNNDLLWADTYEG